MPKISIVPYRVADDADSAGLAIAKSGEMFIDASNGRTLYKKNSSGALLEGLLEETKYRPAVNPLLVANFVNADYLNALFDYSRNTTGTYFNKQGKLVVAGKDEPRFEYDPVTRMAKGLLLESSAYNYLRNSDSLIGSQWSLSNCTTVAGAAVSPTGETNATKLVESADATATWHQLGQSYNNTPWASTSQVYMNASVFAKAGERSALLLRITGDVNAQTSGAWAIFDLANGTVSTPAQYSATAAPVLKAVITPCGNGWYRCSIGARVSDGANQFSWTAMVMKSTSHPDGLNYVGDGTSGVYLYGAQAEYSIGPTSYISSGSSATARAADFLILQGENAGGILSNDTSFFVEFDQAFGAFTELSRVVSATRDVTPTSWYNEYCLLFSPTAQNLYIVDRAGDSTLSGSVNVPVAANTVYRACFGYSPTATRGAINGSIGADTAGITLDPNYLRVGPRPGGDEDLSCHIRHFIVYPGLLSATEMKTLSTL